ncbi:S-adenosyl-L-methionine-dependent methyltransferases superfamily protein, putative isoform 2 [Hibiscus syriacus]|uniref:S-adenosyl-L-methionine-dependent methyltransferases superfamily protein, putative isoform 2 n=1 Tax=Hibiscus syriacus TaxID=106335 RepID=A0A6A2ZJ85_HIBSY|nr:S-adenosyl-L-methionine-dependent methyltransferases superfamily protein, putative isoform 2 [Hibiscus syriacus]
MRTVSFVGEMLVEDVEIESADQGREFRRRLRFKRMPNLVQTEIRIVPKGFSCLDSLEIGSYSLEFSPDLGALVHVFLVPMVASLALIGSRIEELVEAGLRPKALCLGLEVSRVAHKYFGLEDGDQIRVCVGDGMKLMDKLAHGDVGHTDPKFDVIMVDLHSDNLRIGEVFPYLYEIDVGNGENFVLIAAMALPCSSSISDCENMFLQKLRLVISGAHGSIKRIGSAMSSRSS